MDEKNKNQESKKQWDTTSQKSMIFDDCQSSLNFEALKGVVCKGTCFRENQGFSGP